MKINRRFFLSATGILVGGTALGSFLSWKNAKEADIIVAILKNRLGELNIDKGVFETYSIEVVERRQRFKKELKLLGTFSSIFSVITPYSLLPMQHSFRKLENYTISNFLLSTDFFQNKADTTRKINYLGFHDPYKRPCTNFFNH
ncbi:MAG: hypothetical protein ACRBCI_05315 [Cellvibrionaceae bacterium]